MLCGCQTGPLIGVCARPMTAGEEKRRIVPSVSRTPFFNGVMAMIGCAKEGTAFQPMSRSKEDLQMRHFDLTPLYRSTVGFDRLFSMLDNAGNESNAGYPPYNIELTGENAYRITMAVAGFAEEDLSIESKESILVVKGEKQVEEEEEGRILHRGIAARAFERRFQLADHVEVRGASLKNGLLHIDLVREIPEAMKPRKIEIRNANEADKQIEATAA